MADQIAASTAVRVAGLDFDRLTEAQVVSCIISELQAGRGGWVVTPNVDICRAAAGNPVLRQLVSGASLVVPDGMPILWAARLGGDELPERVTGSSLIFTLSEAAARSGRAVYLLGGEPGVPERAGAELERRYPGLVVAGHDAPAVGFDTAEDGVAAVRGKLAAAGPDIVYVGLGFPKQEQVITRMRDALPAAWFICCGAAIPFAAGALRRAPPWMQQAGLEWAFRLASEPRRLFRRYIVHDLPFALALLAVAAAQRARGRLAR